MPRRKVSVNGVTFTLSCINWITHFRWYLFKNKEQEVRDYIDSYIKEGDVFFDIGANVGVFSIYGAKRHKNIEVHSFEPEYSNLNLLKENVVLNNLTKQIKIHSVALSDFVGLSTLNIQDVTPGAAVHTESKYPIGMTDEGYPVIWKEGVVSVTVDFICEQLCVCPNAMKVDTDGNEDKIFRGAVKTLANKALRSLTVEMPMDEAKKKFCYEKLNSHGFSLDWEDGARTRNEIWVRN